MNIQSERILKIYINDKNKEGKPFIDKSGKPFRKIAIQTDQHGAEWLSDLVFKPDDPRLQWRVGDIVEIMTWKNGNYWNFRIPSRIDRLSCHLDEVEKRLSVLETGMESRERSGLPRSVDTAKAEDEAETEIGNEDISSEALPF